MCENCKGCAYWRRLGGGSSPYALRACHYLLDTGRARGGSPDDCTKKVAGRRQRRVGEEWRKLYGGATPQATA